MTFFGAAIQPRPPLGALVARRLSVRWDLRMNKYNIFLLLFSNWNVMDVVIVQHRLLLLQLVGGLSGQSLLVGVQIN